MSAGEGHSVSFFFFRPVLLLVRSLVLVSSGRIVSSPSRGSVAGRASWRRAIRLGGLVVRFGCSSLVPFLRLALRVVRFPRIGLRAGGGVRHFCQFISCDIPWLRWRGGSFSLTRFVRLRSSRLSVLSIPSCGASRVYSLRFARPSVLSHRFVGVSLFVSLGGSFLSHCLSCSSFLDVLSLRFISLAFRCSVSLRSSCQVVRVLSFRLAACLGGSWSESYSPSRSFLFSSRLFAVSHVHGDGGLSRPCLVAACLFSVAIRRR